MAVRFVERTKRNHARTLLGNRVRAGPRLNIGPVATTLTQSAADALNQAFGVSALSDDTVLGDATIRYRLLVLSR